MIDVTKLYSEEIEDFNKYSHYDGPRRSGRYPWGLRHIFIYDYQPMIDAFGKVAIQVEDHDYLGDTRVLYDNDGRIGHLIFGWGSCSGCDALQGCNTVEDVQELCNDLENSIRWFDTKEEAIEWFENHDWEGDWTYRDDNTKDYIRKVLEYLKGKASS